MSCNNKDMAGCEWARQKSETALPKQGKNCKFLSRKLIVAWNLTRNNNFSSGCLDIMSTREREYTELFCLEWLHCEKYKCRPIGIVLPSLESITRYLESMCMIWNIFQLFQECIMWPAEFRFYKKTCLVLTLMRIEWSKKKINFL